MSATPHWPAAAHDKLRATRGRAVPQGPRGKQERESAAQIEEIRQLVPLGAQFCNLTKHETRRRRRGRKIGLLLQARRQPKQERSQGSRQGDEAAVLTELPVERSGSAISLKRHLTGALLAHSRGVGCVRWVRSPCGR